MYVDLHSSEEQDLLDEVVNRMCNNIKIMQKHRAHRQERISPLVTITVYPAPSCHQLHHKVRNFKQSRIHKL